MNVNPKNKDKHCNTHTWRQACAAPAVTSAVESLPMTSSLLPRWGVCKYEHGGYTLRCHVHKCTTDKSYMNGLDTRCCIQQHACAATRTMWPAWCLFLPSRICLWSSCNRTLIDDPTLCVHVRSNWYAHINAYCSCSAFTTCPLVWASCAWRGNLPTTAAVPASVPHRLG